MTDQELAAEIIRLIEMAQDRPTVISEIKKEFCMNCFSTISGERTCWACYESYYEPYEPN